MAKKMTVGTVMADGSIYGGISPDTKKPFYVVAHDAPLSLSFKKAAEYAERLSAHGHKDWHLPTESELEVMFNQRAAIGGFNQTAADEYNRYYSSSVNKDYPELAHVRRFTDGATAWVESASSVRCVRYG